MNDRSCPHCGWVPLEFIGTFYTLESGKIEYNVSVEDLIEVHGCVEGFIPANHYPKISNHSKYGWDEIYMCPTCGEEFQTKN